MPRFLEQAWRRADLAAILKAANVLLTTCRDYIKAGVSAPPPVAPPKAEARPNFRRWLGPGRRHS